MESVRSPGAAPELGSVEAAPIRPLHLLDTRRKAQASALACLSLKHLWSIRSRLSVKKVQISSRAVTCWAPSSYQASRHRGHNGRDDLAYACNPRARTEIVGRDQHAAKRMRKIAAAHHRVQQQLELSRCSAEGSRTPLPMDGRWVLGLVVTASHPEQPVHAAAELPDELVPGSARTRQ